MFSGVWAMVAGSPASTRHSSGRFSQKAVQALSAEASPAVFMLGEAAAALVKPITANAARAGAKRAIMRASRANQGSVDGVTPPHGHARTAFVTDKLTKQARP
jgi:hypothetical protein